MGDLISRKDAIVLVQKYNSLNGLGTVETLESMFNKLRTAYDFEGIIKELGELRLELLNSSDYESEIINYCLDWMDAAINIVEKGRKL